MAYGACDWKWADVQVFELSSATSRLWSDDVDRDITGQLQRLNWPKNVLVTQNFMSCAERSDMNMSVHIRRANNLVIFVDQTVLLISEREAEHILRVLRQEEQFVSACLVNLAMCRWTSACARQAWAQVPLAVGPPAGPPSKFKRDLHHAIVSAQLFSGETEFECQAETSAGNIDRRAAVVDIVFGGRTTHLSRLVAAAVAQALVQLRGRQQCWHGSDLQGICIDETRT